MFEWWDRILAIPFDLILELNEARLLIEWDDYAVSLALPISILATVVAIIIQFWCYSETLLSNQLFAPNYQDIKQLIIDSGFLKSTVPSASLALLTMPVNGWRVAYTILWTICLMSAYLVLTLTKEYGLLYTENQPNLKLAIKRLLQFVTHPFRYLLTKIFSEFSQIPKEENDIDLNRQIWTMQVWNPSKFGLYLQVAFNPVNLAIITWVKCLMIALFGTVTVVLVLVYYLIFKFRTLLHDRGILHGEMMSEYYTKFVKPRTQVLKRDVAIDAGLGPWRAMVYEGDQPYTYTKLRVFVTHDDTGKEVVEYVEPEEDDSVQVNQDPQAVLERLRHENEELRWRNRELLRLLLRQGSRQGLVVRHGGHLLFSGDDDDDYDDSESQLFTLALKRQKYPFQNLFRGSSPQRGGKLSAMLTPKLQLNSVPSTRSPLPHRPRRLPNHFERLLPFSRPT